jgi:hypothetical protein
MFLAAGKPPARRGLQDLPGENGGDRLTVI